MEKMKMVDRLLEIISNLYNFRLNDVGEDIILFSCSTTAFFIQGRLILESEFFRLQIFESNALHTEELVSFRSVEEFSEYIMCLDSKITKVSEAITEFISAFVM